MMLKKQHMVFFNPVSKLTYVSVQGIYILFAENFHFIRDVSIHACSQRIRTCPACEHSNRLKAVRVCMCTTRVNNIVMHSWIFSDKIMLRCLILRTWGHWEWYSSSIYYVSILRENIEPPISGTIQSRFIINKQSYDIQY
jgi:hypothetical protein